MITREIIEELGWEHDQTTKKDGSWFFKGKWNSYMINEKDGYIKIWDTSLNPTEVLYEGTSIEELKKVNEIVAKRENK